LTEYGAFIFDSVGCTGTAIILITYFLNQCTLITTANLSYSILNLVGAIMILISLMSTWNLASVIMEIFWIAISIFGVFRWFRMTATSR